MSNQATPDWTDLIATAHEAARVFASEYPNAGTYGSWIAGWCVGAFNDLRPYDWAEMFGSEVPPRGAWDAYRTAFYAEVKRLKELKRGIEMSKPTTKSDKSTNQKSAYYQGYEDAWEVLNDDSPDSPDGYDNNEWSTSLINAMGDEFVKNDMIGEPTIPDGLFQVWCSEYNRGARAAVKEWFSRSEAISCEPQDECEICEKPYKRSELHSRQCGASDCTGCVLVCDACEARAEEMGASL